MLLGVSARRLAVLSCPTHADRLDEGSSKDFFMSGTCTSLARGIDACAQAYLATRVPDCVTVRDFVPVSPSKEANLEE